MIEGKKILITGGAGFIGTNLSLKLSEKNEITVFDNLHRNALSTTGLVGDEQVRLVQGDVCDYDSLARAIEGHEVVIHMASIAGVDTVMRNPVRTMRVALEGTMNALEACLQLDKLDRFLDFSTSEVFGRYAYKVTEGDTSQLGAVGEARWTYAVAKLATEHLAMSYYKQYAMPAVSIRPFNIYGPRQVGEGAIHHFIARALRGEPLQVHNDGAQIRSWCYVDDIVEGICRCLVEDSAVGESFNIGNPRSTLTIYNLAHEIVRLVASPSSVECIPWEQADVELRIPDIDKARTLLNYEPRVDLQEGLQRTIDWYRSQGRVGA